MNTPSNDQFTKETEGGLPSRGTILCVFTEDASVDAYETALSGCGYTLMRARHEMHGYWLSVNTQPDVIVTDSVKPDDESSYLLDCLARNAKTSHIPIVAIVDQVEQQQPGASCLRSLTSCFLQGTQADKLIGELDRLVALRPQPRATPPADHISRFDAFFADLGHAAPKARWTAPSAPSRSIATDSTTGNRSSIDPPHEPHRHRPGRSNEDTSTGHEERLGTRAPVPRD